MSSTNLDILFEDNHLIAINKPSGALVQGDKTGDAPVTDAVKDYLKLKYNKPGDVFLGLPHRLDRPTSGVLLLARTTKALTRLNKMFQDKSLTKTYWAVVEGKFKSEEGMLENFIGKNEKQNKSYISPTEKNGYKSAKLKYRLVGNGDNYSFLEIDLLTGRHHQIRAQLAHEGFCIKGDLKYGAKRSNKDGSIHLHARKLQFVHPVRKEEVVITALPPKDSLWDEFLRLSNK